MATISYDIWVMQNGQRARQTVTEDIPDPSQVDLNRASLLTAAGNAISGNLAALGVSSPTNAQIIAQVRALTRQNNALIRIICGLLDSTDGT